MGESGWGWLPYSGDILPVNVGRIHGGAAYKFIKHDRRILAVFA